MIMIMSLELSARLSALNNTARSLKAGEWLFHRGDPVRSIFVVGSGAIELLRHTGDGKPAILQRAGAGSVLAEASAFSPCYHCDAVASEASALIEIPLAAFLALLDGDPGFSRDWMTYLANQVQKARLRSEILTLRTVRQRLSAWLAFNDGRLPDKGKWQVLAFELGVTPEALYREIARCRNMPTGRTGGS